MKRFLRALDLAIGAGFWMLAHPDGHVIEVDGCTRAEAVHWLDLMKRAKVLQAANEARIDQAHEDFIEEMNRDMEVAAGTALLAALDDDANERPY